MSSDNFTPGILTVIMIIFKVFLIYSGLICSQKQINVLNIQQETYTNYHYIREDTMTKIIATHVRNTNETFIGIVMIIPLEYIVCYHHVHY